MITLLIIADDFTGALDTGVQFAANGAKTVVAVEPIFDGNGLDPDVQVLILNTDSRHLTGQEAYLRISGIVRAAAKYGVSYIYKKTDSALRGNVGAELAAVLDGCEAERLHFIPAFPEMDRVVTNGILCIDGVPVSESVFGKDPFEPVPCSRVTDLIARQTDVPVYALKNGVPPQAELPSGILVYDSQTDQDLEQIGADLAKREELHLCAGCAGFAAVLAKILGLGNTRASVPRLPGGLLVVCGSVNPITVEQLDRAEQEGAKRIRLTKEQIMNINWAFTPEAGAILEDWLDQCRENPVCILDVNNGEHSQGQNACHCDQRKTVSDSLGNILRRMIDLGLNNTLLVTGGDTLLSFVKQAAIRELTPICELMPGIVLSQFRWEEQAYFLISKSGGFGSKTLIWDIVHNMGMAQVS